LWFDLAKRGLEAETKEFELECRNVTTSLVMGQQTSTTSFIDKKGK